MRKTTRATSANSVLPPFLSRAKPHKTHQAARKARAVTGKDKSNKRAAGGGGRKMLSEGFGRGSGGRLPIHGQQFINAAHGVALNSQQHVCDVMLRVHFVGHTGTHQRLQDRQMLSCNIVAHKQKVPATNGYRS